MSAIILPFHGHWRGYDIHVVDCETFDHGSGQVWRAIEVFRSPWHDDWHDPLGSFPDRATARAFAIDFAREQGPDHRFLECAA